MGKHVPLPTDPQERRLEQWRRHLRCVQASRAKRTQRIKQQRLAAEATFKPPTNLLDP